MSLNLLAIPMAETQTRDANHLRWQERTGLGIRDSGPEYRKMELRETLMGLLL